MDIVPQLIANSLIAGSIYAILTLGFNLTYASAKFIDMGFGVMTAIGGYTVFYVSKTLGAPLWLGLIAGILLSGFVSFLAYTFIYKPLRARKSSGAVLLIASLGTLTAVQAVIAILFTSQFQTLSGLLHGNRVFELFGAAFTAVQLSIFCVGVLLFLLLAFLLKKTLFGKATVAISDDEEVAKIVGIDTDRIMGRLFSSRAPSEGSPAFSSGLTRGLSPSWGSRGFLRLSSRQSSAASAISTAESPGRFFSRSPRTSAFGKSRGSGKRPLRLGYSSSF